MSRSRTLVSLTALATLLACGKSNDEPNTAGVPAILFIKRQHTVVAPDGTVTVDVAGGNGQVLDYDRYVPGGSLNLMSPARPDGTITNLTADYATADFNGADVSFDGQQAVFSMKKDDQDKYHLYTVALTGDHEIHQLTAGDEDDINPIYIPGGRIAFATNQMYTPMGTRADEYEHARVVTQLATISIDGGDADRRLFAQNLSHTVAPFLRADGKIGYSRWEHLGPVNDVKIMTSNPDGTNMIAVGGQHDKPSNSLFSIRETNTPNVMIGIATTRDRTIHAGALVLIDARNQKIQACVNPNATDLTGNPCLDEEHVQYQVLTPDVPVSSAPSPVGRYREPSMLPDGRYLVSWADGPVNDLNEQSATPPDFGIYIYDPASGKNQLITNDRQTWELNALAVVARAEPPVIGDLQQVQDGTKPVRIGSVDVTQTSLNGADEQISGAQFSNTGLGDALHSAVAVRVIEGFSSEAAKGVTMFGLTMDEGACILGETKIFSDGSWLANVPPFIPMHLQPIDKFGMAIRSQRLWIQGMPNEDRRCIGCHESRTNPGSPRSQPGQTVAEQHQAENLVVPLDQRYKIRASGDSVTVGEYGWDVSVQPLFHTNKCDTCHNATTNGNGPQTFYSVTRTDPATGTTTTYNIPTLDLSNTPITVVYDRKVATYPAAYVSIFYPAAMMMTPGTTVTGTVPPKWGVPDSARASALIEKVNLRASDGSTAWPTNTHPLHPEDIGVQMSDNDRAILVRVMDLGGQYYARQNTGFVPFARDPVAGQKY
jgi:hypothetical protein